MLERLGNVIYWAGCIIGAGCVLFGMLGALSSASDDHFQTSFFFGFTGSGFIFWLIGRAAQNSLREPVPYEEHWDNGQLRRKGTRKNGELHGPWASYHQNGQLENQGTFKNGKENGHWVAYHENGQLKTKGDFKHGKFDGHWVDYDENGVKVK